MDEKYNIKDIQLAFKEDVAWSPKTIENYLVTLPIKIAKYQSYWYYFKRKYEQLQKEYDDMWFSKYSYYKNGESDLALSTAEIKQFVERDTEINKINLRMKTEITNCELIEKMLKNLDSTRWDIKNYIEFEKFANGVF